MFRDVTLWVDDDDSDKASLLETVITCANDGIMITTAGINEPDPKIVYVNNAFSEITGYNIEEVYGKSPRILQGPDTSRQTLNEIRVALTEGKAFKGEILNYGKNGNPYWLSLSIVPVFDKNGKITHFAAIERDITDKKESERKYEEALRNLKRANLRAEAAAAELHESLKVAEEANRSKSDFLANMSHELRTPMNGVIGMTHLLQDTELSAEQKEYVQTISGSAETLLVLLNDILDISKIEAGALQLERIPFSLRDVIQETVNLFSIQARKKSVALIVECESSVPDYIYGDPGRLRQILTNLVGNALKFTNEGYIRIAVKLEENEDIKHLAINVEDTGVGIPADKLESIFEKFSQADTSVTRKFGGTGLGLTISKQLIELMGGNIGVESAYGKGSTFWFNIVLDVSNESEYFKYINLNQPSQTSAYKRLNADDAKVLLVEDFPVNQVFAEKLLRKMGFVHIDKADNGEQAVGKYSKADYDIIFMDCQMPELDGYQATEVIRGLEESNGKRVPIVAMTANAMVGDREKCLKAGMDDYISKPIRPERLKKILEQRFIFQQKEKSDDKILPKAEIMDYQPVDMEQLNMFTEGNIEEEKSLVDLFMSQASEIIGLLEKNTEAFCAEEWKSAAHRFKGASGNLGAVKLHHLCLKAEQNYDIQKENKIKILCDIKNELNAVSNFFQNRFGN